MDIGLLVLVLPMLAYLLFGTYLALRMMGPEGGIFRVRSFSDFLIVTFVGPALYVACMMSNWTK